MSDTYTSGLDPTTQAIIQMLLAQGGVGGQPSWQGAASADVLNNLSLGFEPNQLQADMLGGLALPPKKEGDVGTREDLAARFNIMQDYNSLMADPMTGLLTGAGGYSADAFAPTVERELIPMEETRRFNQWLQDPTSFEGWVANRVAQGKSPRAAIVEMRQIYERGTAEDATPEQQADAERIRLIVTPERQRFNDVTGEPYADSGGPDWAQAFDDADKLIQPYLDEQRDNPVGPVAEVRDQDGNLISSGGEIVQGDDGNLYRVTTTDSPLAEKYHELGIPLPTEQYTPGDLLGAEWQQAEQSWLNSIPAMDDAYRQLEQDRNRALRNAAGLNPAQTTLDLSSAPGYENWTPTSTAATPAAGGAVDEARVEANVVNPATDAQIAAVMAMDPTQIPAALADLNLTRDQRDQLTQWGDQQAAQHSNDPSYADWVGVQQAIGGAAAPPPSASRGQYSVEQQLRAIAGLNQGVLGMGGIDQRSEMDAIKQGSLDPAGAQRWLVANWGGLSDEERNQVIADLNSNSMLTQGQAFNGGGDTMALSRAWQDLAQRFSGLEGAADVAEYNAGSQGGGGGVGGRGRVAAVLRQPADVKPMGGGAAGAVPSVRTLADLLPMGGNPPGGPPAPTPSGNDTSGGFTRNAIPPAVTDAMLAAVLGGSTGAMSQLQPAPDWYAYQGGYSPQGPVNNAQMGPIPGSQDWLDMQTQGFQGWPTATDALSYQNQRRHRNISQIPPSEYNPLSGGSANAGGPPQQAGVPTIGDYLTQYVLNGGTANNYGGPPPQPEYNPLPGNRNYTSIRTGPEPSETAPVGDAGWNAVLARQQALQDAIAGGAISSGLGVAPQAIDANTLAALAGGRAWGSMNQSRRTGPEPSETAARRTSNVSTRTGPEPSETAGNYSSTRTGPEPSEQATRPSLWSQIGGGKQPDQATAQAILRFMLGRGQGEGGGTKQTEDQRLNGKQRLSFGRQATPGETYRLSERARADRLGRSQREAIYAENMAFRNVYGRDYYQARGYTNRLRQLGITPTQVALASRSGALRTAQGY